MVREDNPYHAAGFNINVIGDVFLRFPNSSRRGEREMGVVGSTHGRVVMIGGGRETDKSMVG